MSKTYVPAQLRRDVRERAGGCCEYCRQPEADGLFAHEVEHVIAEKHNGETISENLALACALCNKFKGTDLASIDPDSNEMVRLFHPRIDTWSDLLRSNREDCAEIRRLQIRAGVFG